jgi:putative ABC transport system permease protein
VRYLIALLPIFRIMRIVIHQIRESIKFAFKSLRVNPLRSFLSLFSVMVGIFLIIAVFSAVDSIERDISESFSVMGDDLLFIQKMPFGPEEGDEEYAWWKYHARDEPSLRDFQLLEERLDDAEAVAFQTATSKTIEYKNSSVENMFVMGASHSYKDVFTLKIDRGRYFTNHESGASRNVCLIGYEVANALFGDANPIDRVVKVGGHKLNVIGTFEKEGASLMQNGFDMVVLMPVGFATRLMNVDKQPNNSIIVKPKNGVSPDWIKGESIAIFRTIRGLKPKQGNDFSVMEASMLNEMMDAFFAGFRMFASTLGIAALFVGLFGILNIMYVSVKERTPIIGIQKALGARNFFVLSSFIVESICLCLMGGLGGLLMVYLVFALLNTMDIGLTFVLGMNNAILGISISTVIGVLAGILPAIKASRLSPVEAIRS